MKAKEKLIQYGLLALSDNELLEIIKFKGNISDYYESPEYKAAKELVRRKDTPDKIKISSSKNAYELLSFLETETAEQFWTIFVNRRNSVIAYELISIGNATATTVNIQKLFKRALELNAQGLILAHNHPSGHPSPSQSDTTLTNNIKQAVKIFDIALLDHVIIGSGKYFSYADEGLI